MKLAHISDLHLGYKSGNKRSNTTGINLREQDGYDILEKIITQIIENQVDAVVCTGDFFHIPTPSIYTIVKGQEQLRRLSEAGIKFYNLAGNHDASDSVVDIPANRALHCPELGLYSFIEPYVVQDIGENVCLHLISHHNFLEQTETMDKVSPINDKINILCTHGSVYNPLTKLILHNELSPREIIIPEDIIHKDWDYILLGHIHERGWVGSEDGTTDSLDTKTFYGGSILRRGFTDKECNLGRGWTLWDIKNKNEITPTFFTIEQRPQYDFNINCLNKNVIDIEKEIYNIFNKINLEDIPILRISLSELSIQNKSLIDWKKFAEYTSKCLSFTTKTKTKEEITKEIENIDLSFDLNTAYKEFYSEIKEKYNQENREKIEKSAIKLLNKGQEIILSKI